MKKGLRIFLIFLVIIGGLWVISPHNSTLDMEVNATEYKLDAPAYAVPHTVTIQGRYTWRLLGKDSFEGTLAVSGIESTQPPQMVRVVFTHGNRAMVTYVNEAYLHRTEEVATLYATPRFEEAVLLLYEVERLDENESSASWDSKAGRFITLSAQSREEAIALLNQLAAEQL